VKRRNIPPLCRMRRIIIPKTGSKK